MTENTRWIKITSVKIFLVWTISSAKFLQINQLELGWEAIS
ncbi:MAG: hypothetical protein SH817_05475 [Leptospira sp.]|nr:hypothetical protein [Leptospira sp.]